MWGPQRPKFWIWDFGFWILDFGFWILDFGFRILDFGFRILDFGALCSISFCANFGFWISDFGFWILDFGFWILDFGFRILDFGFRILDFGFRILDFEPNFGRYLIYQAVHADPGRRISYIKLWREPWSFHHESPQSRSLDRLQTGTGQRDAKEIKRSKNMSETFRNPFWF